MSVQWWLSLLVSLACLAVLSVYSLAAFSHSVCVSPSLLTKDELCRGKSKMDSSTKQSSYKRSLFGSPIAPWMETTRTSLLHSMTARLLTNHRALNPRQTQLVASFFDLCALLSSITLFIGLYIYVQQCYKHSMLQNIRILVFRLNIFIFFYPSLLLFNVFNSLTYTDTSLALFDNLSFYVQPSILIAGMKDWAY